MSGFKKLTKERLSMIIAGVGGQGNVLLSAFIGQAFLNQGYQVSVVDTYGVSQRGGSVASHIKVSKDTLYSSVTLRGNADVVLGMEPVEALRILSEFGNTDTLSIVNSRPIYPIGGAIYPQLEIVKESIESLSAKTVFVNATQEALKMGNPILTNIVLLGALVGADILPINKETVLPLLKDRFPGKVLDTNIKAFDAGMAMTAQ